MGVTPVLTTQALCHVTVDAGTSGDDGGASDDAGAAEDFTVYFGSVADDDDCKYHVSFTTTPVLVNTNVTFNVTATKLAENNAPASGADVVLESYLADNDFHVIPNNGTKTTESPAGSGKYTMKPIKFDASGRWVVRFHFYESCDDILEDSPHGHITYSTTFLEARLGAGGAQPRARRLHRRARWRSHQSQRAAERLGAHEGGRVSVEQMLQGIAQMCLRVRPDLLALVVDPAAVAKAAVLVEHERFGRVLSAEAPGEPPPLVTHDGQLGAGDDVERSLTAGMAFGVDNHEVHPLRREIARQLADNRGASCSRGRCSRRTR